MIGLFSFLRRHTYAVYTALFRYLPYTGWAGLFAWILLTLLLSLPLTLFLSIENSAPLFQKWQSELTVHVYLHKHIPDQQITAFYQDITQRGDVDDVQLITPQAGWQRLLKQAKWLQATPLASATSAPLLPAVLIISPHLPIGTPFSTAHPLYQYITHLPLVEHVYFNATHAVVWPSIRACIRSMSALIYVVFGGMVVFFTPYSLRNMVHAYRTAPYPTSPPAELTSLYASIILSISACCAAYGLAHLTFRLTIAPFLLHTLSHYQLPTLLKGLSFHILGLLMGLGGLLGLWGGLWGNARQAPHNG